MFESTVIVQVALFASAAAVTSLPTKFKIVILFAVPTTFPSSLTVIPVMSPAPVVLTGCQFQLPDPSATGTSFALPDVPLVCASFPIYAFASVEIPLMFAPLAPSILPFTSSMSPTVVIPAKAALPFFCQVVRPTVIPIPVVNKVCTLL